MDPTAATLVSHSDNTSLPRALQVEREVVEMALARRPELIALALVTRDGQVLLVKHAYDQQLWGLPGGMVEQGETTSDAAVREVQEETGLQVAVTGLLAVADRGDRLILVHGAVVIGGSLNARSAEIETVCWFPRQEVPALRDVAFALALEIVALAGGDGSAHQLHGRVITGPDGSHIMYGVAHG